MSVLTLDSRRTSDDTRRMDGAQNRYRRRSSGPDRPVVAGRSGRRLCVRLRTTWRRSRIGGEAAGPSFAEQARQAFANLDAVLRAGGSRPELVVSAIVLVADQSSFPELNSLLAEFFPSEPPARMTMQVPLPLGLLISIECTAISES